MREIKFRVWHKPSHTMRVVTTMFFSPDGTLNGAGGHWPNEVYPKAMSELELMQYTGLKDKNGREVYEGDIVLINHPSDMTGDFTNARGEVFWWEEQGGWYHGNGNGRPPKRMWQYVEVIGNIHENPELVNL